MCIPTTLQQNIASITNDGYDIARFLADTMQGKTPGTKVCHRMDAAKHLIKYGFSQEEAKTPSPSTGQEPAPAEAVGRDGGEQPKISSPSCTSMSAPVTYLDILNYETAHLIRAETAEGHTIVNFLVNVMNGVEHPYTPKKLRIKPADRIAAARELLRRGFGEFSRRSRL